MKKDTMTSTIKNTTDPQETDLPDLPSLSKKREQKLTPRVLDWFRKNYKGSCAIEIKATRSRSIPASALRLHQAAALKQVSSSGLAYKIPDEGFSKKPFDAFFLSYSASFVVACFQTEGVCLVIDADKWRGATPDTPARYCFTL